MGFLCPYYPAAISIVNKPGSVVFTKTIQNITISDCVNKRGGIFQRSILLAIAALTIIIAQLSAQSLERDPATGDYILTFIDMDGNDHRLVIEPRDKVNPALDVSIERSGTTFDYRYSLANRPGPGTTQPILLMLLPCPHDDRELSVAPAPGWNAGAAGLNPFACRFSFRDKWLEPGESADGFVIQSSLLPTVSSARAFGVARDAPLPISVGSVADTVITLLENARGMTFNSLGARRFEAVVPGIAPERFANPNAALSLVREDLGHVCGELGWITDHGICRSLEAKLEAAARSLQRGNARSARGQLQSFLNELDAQHGPEPGKHVGASAYALLSANVAYLLERLNE